MVFFYSGDQVNELAGWADGTADAAGNSQMENIHRLDRPALNIFFLKYDLERVSTNHNACFDKPVVGGVALC